MSKSDIKLGSYTLQYNEIFRRPDIPLDAKGLHATLRTFHPDFKINKMTLHKHPHIRSGRDATCRMFAQLEEAGYITRRTIRDKGRIIDVDWTVHAVSTKAYKPLFSDAHRVTEKPVTGKPVTGKPVTENPTLLKTTVKNTKKTINTIGTIEGRAPGGAACSEIGGPPAPNSEKTRKKALDGGCKNGDTEKSATKTAQGAPWAEKSYRGIHRDALPPVETYEDIWALSDDPIFAAIAATREVKAGGWGHWIKWLNSAAALPGETLDGAIEYFLGCLCETWGEHKDNPARSMAATLTTKLKQKMKVTV